MSLVWSVAWYKFLFCVAYWIIPGKIWNINVRGESIPIFISLTGNNRKYGSNRINLYNIH